MYIPIQKRTQSLLTEIELLCWVLIFLMICRVIALKWLRRIKKLNLQVLKTWTTSIIVVQEFNLTKVKIEVAFHSLNLEEVKKSATIKIEFQVCQIKMTQDHKECLICLLEANRISLKKMNRFSLDKKLQSRSQFNCLKFQKNLKKAYHKLKQQSTPCIKA